MTFHYPTTFTDSFGTEETSFFSDGESLSIEIRGVQFQGHFWELQLADEWTSEFETKFNFAQGKTLQGATIPILADFKLWVKIPIQVLTNEHEELDALVEVDKREQTQLYYLIGGRGAKFKRNSFELGLLPAFTKGFQIQYVKCCLNCKFSSYSPFGHDAFGDLMCFKQCKTEWEQIGYHGLYNSANLTKLASRIYVQETYRCEQFVAKGDE